MARDVHRISLGKGQGILKIQALERLKMRWHILKWTLQTCCDDVSSSYYDQWKCLYKWNPNCTLWFYNSWFLVFVLSFLLPNWYSSQHGTWCMIGQWSHHSTCIPKHKEWVSNPWPEGCAKVYNGDWGQICKLCIYYTTYTITKAVKDATYRYFFQVWPMNHPTIMGVALSQTKVGNMWHTASMPTGREFIWLVCNVKIHARAHTHTQTQTPTHKEKRRCVSEDINEL